MSLSPAAKEYGRRAARLLLRGRKGHGGGPCLSRVMGEADLAALAGLAFEAGLNAALSAHRDAAATPAAVTPSADHPD